MQLELFGRDLYFHSRHSLFLKTKNFSCMRDTCCTTYFFNDFPFYRLSFRKSLSFLETFFERTCHLWHPLLCKKTREKESHKSWLTCPFRFAASKLIIINPEIVVNLLTRLWRVCLCLITSPSTSNDSLCTCNWTKHKTPKLLWWKQQYDPQDSYGQV